MADDTYGMRRRRFGRLHRVPFLTESALHEKASVLIVVIMMMPDELVGDLRRSRPDLARIIEAVVRDRLPYVVVPTQAVKSWKRREPHPWARVAEWLRDQHVTLVQV